MAYPQIIEEFLELVRVPTHSRDERAMADILTAKLRALGCTVSEDEAGAAIGGTAGNLTAVWPGRSDREAICFSAHMDRVANPGTINPQADEAGDRITSDGRTILAADDVSGLAAILDGLRRVSAEGWEHGPVEILFSVAEEVGLQGARQLDISGLKSKTAYILDSTGPVGTLVNRAPTQKTILIKITGRSSHAGMAPEKGINAIMAGAKALAQLKEGRLSPLSTSNFGVICGGKATNIVCDYLEIKGEARSHEAGELADYLAEVRKVFSRTAEECGAGLEIDVQLEYSAFYVRENEPIIARALEVFRRLDCPGRIITGGGGMDGNIFNEKGLPSVGLSTGYENVHTEKEEQSISQLILCGRVVAELIKTAPSAQ
jgi:tripeptide aminopeptidase